MSSGRRSSFALKPIVVINKIDRPEARPHEVIDQVFDLMVDLGASDAQLDFPIVYTSAKAGFARREIDHTDGDVKPLLDAIVMEVDPPADDTEGHLQMLVASLDYDNYPSCPARTAGQAAPGRNAAGPQPGIGGVRACRRRASRAGQRG